MIPATLVDITAIRKDNHLSVERQMWLCDTIEELYRRLAIAADREKEETRVLTRVILPEGKSISPLRPSG